MSSPTDGHGGSDLLTESSLKLEFESLDDSSMAQSSRLARSFSMSTEGREALEMLLNSLDEQKLKKDRQIAQLLDEKDYWKREKEELKGEIRYYKTERKNLERLRDKNQVLCNFRNKSGDHFPQICLHINRRKTEVKKLALEHFVRLRFIFTFLGQKFFITKTHINGIPSSRGDPPCKNFSI